MAKFGYFGVNVRCSSIHVGLVQKGEKKERMRRKNKEWAENNIWINKDQLKA